MNRPEVDIPRNPSLTVPVPGARTTGLSIMSHSPLVEREVAALRTLERIAAERARMETETEQGYRGQVETEEHAFQKALEKSRRPPTRRLRRPRFATRRFATSSRRGLRRSGRRSRRSLPRSETRPRPGIAQPRRRRNESTKRRAGRSSRCSRRPRTRRSSSTRNARRN